METVVRQVLKKSGAVVVSGLIGDRTGGGAVRVEEEGEEEVVLEDFGCAVCVLEESCTLGRREWRSWKLVGIGADP